MWWELSLSKSISIQPSLADLKCILRNFRISLRVNEVYSSLVPMLFSLHGLKWKKFQNWNLWQKNISTQYNSFHSIVTFPGLSVRQFKESFSKTKNPIQNLYNTKYYASKKNKIAHYRKVTQFNVSWAWCGHPAQQIDRHKKAQL